MFSIVEFHLGPGAHLALSPVNTQVRCHGVFSLQLWIQRFIQLQLASVTLMCAKKPVSSCQQIVC